MVQLLNYLRNQVPDRTFAARKSLYHHFTDLEVFTEVLLGHHKQGGSFNSWGLARD